jgi:hypothetical protein
MFAVWGRDHGGSGWQLMWSHDIGSGWTVPEPIASEITMDFWPRLTADWLGTMHAVWQRNCCSESEIMVGSRPLGDDWVVEAITENGSEDFFPDIAESTDGKLHVVWVGYDPQSQTGKIFYAVKDLLAASTWSVEVLESSELGPFWSGANPKIAVDLGGVVHVVYRGGDYGNYHAHYARRVDGSWSYMTLTSGNANDFVVDVSARAGWPVTVAMSGNDGWGFPSRIYVRRSFDGGQTFEAPQLASGAISAELGSVSAGAHDIVVVGAQTSGNILTGDLWCFRESDGWAPLSVPPQNQSCWNPSGSQALCVTEGSFHAIAVLYADSRGHEADSTEVFIVTQPVYGAVDPGEEPPAFPGGLRVRAAPNPFSGSTWIGVDGGSTSTPLSIRIYDVEGRLIRRLLDAASASDAWRWQGVDNRGRAVAAGTYFVEVERGSERATGRLVLIR